MNQLGLTSLGLRYTAAWCSRDPERVASFFAEGGVLTINGGAPARGRAAIAEVALGFMATFPNLAVFMEGVDPPGSSESRSVYRWTLTGTNTGPGGTGRHVRISGREEWQLTAEGEIEHSQGFFDESEYQRQLTGTVPPPAVEAASGATTQDGPRGLDGWLILVGLGLALMPLRIVAGLATTDLALFQGDAWTVLTTPGSPFYRPGLAPFLVVEVVLNISFAAAAVFVLVLFFRKSRRFPRAWVILMLANVAFVVGDAIASGVVVREEPMLDENTQKQIARTVVSLVVWLPYMAASKRVKNTFIA